MFTLSGFADEISPRLEDQIRVLQKLGMKHLELRSIEGKNVSDFTDQEALGYKRLLDQGGLRVSAIGSPVGKIKITDPMEPHLRKYGRVLEIAKIFETKVIRIFSFYVEKGKVASSREEVCRRMKTLVEGAEKGDFLLQLENEEGLFAESPENCLDLLSALHHPRLRFTFDFCNFTLRGFDSQKAWDLLAPYTTYFHIKDARTSPPEIVVAGEGEGHIDEILRSADQKGFTGFVSLEPHLGEARRDGGFTGESEFIRAHGALAGVLKSIGAKFN